MTTISASDMTELRTMAANRGRDLRARIGFALFIGIIAWFLVRSFAPLIWFAAVVAGQLIDHLLAAPLRAEQPRPISRARRNLFLFSMAANAALYSALALYLWFEGSPAGKVFAVLSMTGSIINNALQMAPTPLGLKPVLGPHVGFLLGAPLVEGILSPQPDLIQMTLISCGGGVFVLHAWLAVKRIRDTNARMTAAVAQAQQANAAKSDFLATISHEIRTPMNAVVAAGSLLRRTDLTPDQAGHVAMLANASEVLLGLLNDVLNLSRIESGKLEVDPGPFDLVDKLQAATRLWSAKTPAGVTLAFEPGDLPERIVTDPLRFQQIISNLLSNATKFTRRGFIVVRGGRVEADGDAGPRLWVEVEDSGSGMDEETAARVFSSFEQGSTSVTRAHGGTGLGLSISRRLAELMGGSLTVRSQLGVGSVFRLEIPLVLAGAAAGPAVNADSVAEAGADRAVRVLLAEDHEVNQRIVRLMLEPVGAEVTVAGTGAEAVAMALLAPYDVILMDMQMPVMGGVEAAARIRAGDGPNAATPILALTANAMAEHRRQWAEVGVDVFITKPVEMQALIDHVSAAVASAPARSASQESEQAA
ncbi:MAG: response regulator [Caulobacter sp.]|nr:response regulator [Caulobacter sp.]